MKEIIYPISIEYRKHWDEWCCIREIVQNALDSSKETTKIYKQNGNLIIEDKGKGLQVKHLLFGISEKDNKDEARGQFGEGLKIALIVLKRLGYDVEIISNNLLVKPTITEIEGEKCLKIQYDYLPYNYEGTKVTIYNYNGETYQDRFILKQNSNNVLFENEYFGQILKKPENKEDGTLYVKDIYVTKIKNSAFSYNLKNVRLEESRNIADEISLKYQIGFLWAECTDKELWKQLFIAFKNNRYEKECYFTSIPFEDVRKVIKEAFIELFGDAVLETNTILANECIWRNKQTINIFDPDKHSEFYKILPTDKEFLEKEKQSKDLEVNESQLTIEERENLELARQIAKQINKKYEVKVYFMENAEGKVKLGDTLIKLHLNIMKDKQKTISTLIHELTHLEYNVRDMTIQQIHYLSDMGSRIILKLLQNQNENLDEFEASLLESKIGTYRQYRVSIPHKIIEKQKLNKGEKVIVKIKKKA